MCRLASFRILTPGATPPCPEQLHAYQARRKLRAVFYAPFYAAEALGFYASEGVEVEFMNSPAPAAAQSGLLDGTIDLSWGGPLRELKARDQDPNSSLVCFCEVVARDPFFLIGRSNPPFRLTDLSRLLDASISVALLKSRLLRSFAGQRRDREPNYLISPVTLSTIGLGVA